MANIGVELKRLLTKLGGTPSKYDQTNELLHKITDQVNAGGSGGGGLVITAAESGTKMTLDKTWEEINATFSAAQPCVVKWGTGDQYSETYYSVLGCSYNDGRYDVLVWNGSGSISMHTDDADGYPYYSFE